ncbi:MAG: sulfotransferase domain-containing protein [Pseudomonadota bacterium]
MKTHNLNAKFGEHHFTSEKYTFSVIYLVRDPRDVLVSYAKHSGLSLDDMRDAMLFPRHKIGEGPDYVEFIGDWRTHVLTWEKALSRPRLLLRYEDLIDDPITQFRRLADFTGVRIADPDLAEIVDSVHFDALKAREERDGFDEATKNSVFFRQGTVGGWRELDYARYIEPLERAFGPTMARLGYAPLKRKYAKPERPKRVLKT